MEATMPLQTSMHFYLNWAKERLDEMDATLASLEDQASELQAASRKKADQLLADLRKRRHEFQEGVKMQAETSEAAWLRTKAQLDAQWNGFEAEVKKYIETFSRKGEQQKATFQKIAAAQLKAWQDASDKVHAGAAEFAAERRADIDAAVKQMKANASEAEATFRNLARAGTASWTGLAGALAQSRAAFDGALQAAADAFKRAGQPGVDKPSAEPPR
jgi:hypothetical protein